MLFTRRYGINGGQGAPQTLDLPIAAKGEFATMTANIAQPLAQGNSPRGMLRLMLAERRLFPRGSADWKWRTSAARKYVNMIRGVPVDQWSK